MTLDSFINDSHAVSSHSEKPIIISKNVVLKKLQNLLEALHIFKNNYDKRLNLTSLCKRLRIPNSEVNIYISIIQGFQELFNTVLSDYTLYKKTANGNIYLITRSKNKEDQPLRLIEVHLSQKEVTLLNDLSYFFKFIKRGKPFKISEGTHEILKNLASLTISHPFFFKVDEEKIYLSEIGLELGSTIHTYKKANKRLDKVEILNYTFIFD
ncbi:MAG: hypothetical protein ACTSR8_14055 [Promethearchaeota archaeon]